ncbi:MAG: urate oxidase [Thermoleophilia bacterium]|nr:urate oxidase [Thermoleophilia bacterium]
MGTDGARLAGNQYGKARVRVARVERGADGVHRFVDRTVRVALRGDFTAAHVEGDNAHVIATDTMKNTVHALTEDAADGESVESFLLRLHDHFGGKADHIDGVLVEASEAGYRHIDVDGAAHPYAFEQLRERRTARLDGMPRDRVLHGGIEELSILKTTESWFRDFPRDEFTTLPETDDRVMATIVTGSWRFTDEAADFEGAWRVIRAALMETFATHPSPSVQATLFEMASAALAACPAIDEVSLALPNRHYIPLDLTAIGRSRGAVLLPTDEPHGLIEATVTRT